MQWILLIVIWGNSCVTTTQIKTKSSLECESLSTIYKNQSHMNENWSYIETHCLKVSK